jgi:hypothetical protein
MATVSVDVRRHVPHEPVLDLAADLERARVVAQMLDSKFELAGIRFGLDAVMGLVPVVGDTVSLLLGMYPLYLARKHKLGKSVELRMLANLAVDYVGGLVPLAGDVFDVAFKANLKNFALLEKAAAKRGKT